jgi:hypothetical protein
MPLLPAVFAEELDKFGNPSTPGFAPPADAVDAAAKHAHAFRVYMATLANPIVPPQAHDVAEAAMQAALLGQDAPPPAGIAAINAGYSAYVGAIALAAAATGQVTATPQSPPGPIPAFVVPTNGMGSIAYAGGVHLWVLQGKTSIPPAPPAPWS